MERHNPPNANSHTTWASSTKTLVGRPRETRTAQYHTLSSFSTAGTPIRAPGPAGEPRSVEYPRMRVPGGCGPPQMARPQRTDSGAPQGQSTLQDGTNAPFIVVRARNIYGDTSSPAIRENVSIHRTPQTIKVKTPGRQSTTTTPNIPSGSRIDKWRNDVASAMKYIPAARASPAPQASTASPSDLPRSPTARQPRPVRYYEYVHGPDDGVSHYSSEDGLHEECLGPSMRNATPIPSSSTRYGHRLNTVARNTRLQGAASVDRDLDPSEY